MPLDHPKASAPIQKGKPKHDSLVVITSTKAFNFKQTHYTYMHVTDGHKQKRNRIGLFRDLRPYSSKLACSWRAWTF